MQAPRATKSSKEGHPSECHRRVPIITLAPYEDNFGEWPTLGPKHQNSSTYDGSIPAKEQRPAHVTANNDSAKENRETSKPQAPPTSKRRGSKQKWVPLQVELVQDDKQKQSRDTRPFKQKDNVPIAHTGLKYGDKKKEDTKITDSRKEWYRKAPRKVSENTGDRKINGAFGSSKDSEALFCTPILSSPSTFPKLSVMKQMEYYFSVENLQKDFFIRRKMDRAGFVPLVIPAGFPKIRQLTEDFGDILKAVKASSFLEVAEDPAKGFMVRTRFNPEYWPIHDALSTEFCFGVPARNYDAPAPCS